MCVQDSRKTFYPLWYRYLCATTSFLTRVWRPFYTSVVNSRTVVRFQSRLHCFYLNLYLLKYHLIFVMIGRHPEKLHTWELIIGYLACIWREISEIWTIEMVSHSLQGNEDNYNITWDNTRICIGGHKTQLSDKVVSTSKTGLLIRATYSVHKFDITFVLPWWEWERYSSWQRTFAPLAPRDTRVS